MKIRPKCTGTDHLFILAGCRFCLSKFCLFLRKLLIFRAALGCLSFLMMKDLEVALREGLLYIVLDESITAEEARIVSDWRNSDQDQNQRTNEAQIFRAVLQLVQDHEKTNASKPLSLAQICAKMQTGSIQKMSSTVVSIIAKTVTQLGAGEKVEEFLDTHVDLISIISISCLNKENYH